MGSRRAALVGFVTLAAAAAGAVPLAGAAGLHGRAAHDRAASGCRATITTHNWRAVFGHDATLIASKRRVKQLVALGYRTAKSENRGCNDYAAVLESPKFSSYQVRAAFATEVAKGRLVVSFAAPGDVVPAPGSVNVTFGHRPTLAAAVTLLAKVAASGWRDTDIAYGGPRDWKVVWPNVPGAAAEQTVLAAQKAGLAIELELIAP